MLLLHIALWNGRQEALQELMKQIILAVIFAALPAIGFAAESDNKAAKTPAGSKRQTGTNGQAKSCSEYGDGFVKLEGSSTCVKVDGYVRFQTGRSR